MMNMLGREIHHNSLTNQTINAALRLAVEGVLRISVHFDFGKEMKVFSEHRKLTRGETEATHR
jgi:hypothetical protein